MLLAGIQCSNDGFRLKHCRNDDIFCIKGKLVNFMFSFIVKVSYANLRLLNYLLNNFGLCWIIMGQSDTFLRPELCG